MQTLAHCRSQPGWAAPFLATALLAAFCLAGCSDEPPAKEAESPVEPPRNVILIVVDALRPDHLGAYGYQRDTSPNLDRFAEGGTLFTRAYSAASWTLPSVASMMTSVYPEVHGLRRPPTESALFSLPAGFLTLAESLKAAGLRTASITSQPWISDKTGLTQGFDEVRTVSHASAPGEARRLTGELIDWMEERGNEPFFLYAHYMGPHSPYDVPSNHTGRFTSDFKLPPAVEEFHRIYEFESEVDAYRLITERARSDGLSPADANYLRAEYDEKLAFTDEWIGVLLRWLDENGRYDDSLIIVTADHGEAFYEHGTIFHGQNLHEELVRVPLIIKTPRGDLAGNRIEEVVELVDLYPTIHDFMDLSLPSYVVGESLVPVMAGASSDGVAMAEYYGFKITTRDWSSFYEYTDRLHLKSGFAISEMYDLARDPLERRNIAGTRPDVEEQQREIAYRLWGRMSTLARDHTFDHHEIELDEDTIDELQSLGYLTGG